MIPVMMPPRANGHAEAQVIKIGFRRTNAGRPLLCNQAGSQGVSVINNVARAVALPNVPTQTS